MELTVGMDEVGRGSWAGPVLVGAVILAAPIDGLRDSKQLTKHRREALDVQIYREAVACSVGMASPQEIDEFGLTAGLKLAYGRALAAITKVYELIIIDGGYNFLPGDTRVQTLIKADQLIPAVSAASIIAKVARDRLMAQLSSEHPGYGFENNVGYGTAQHLKMLQQLGASNVHRRSFRPVQQVIMSRV